MLTAKYLKFSDFLEFQLMIHHENMEEGFKPVLAFAIGMLDVMDFDKSALVLIEYNLYDLFLDLEVHCTT